MNKKQAAIVLLPITLLLFLVISGCAGIMDAGRPPATDEEILRTKINLLSQAKKDNKWDIVYRMYDAAYQKTISEQAFLAMNRGVTFGEYTIEKIEIDQTGRKAQVTIRSDVMAQGMNFKNSPAVQHWIKEDGEWHCQVKTAEQLFSR
ncbi:MAG: hypothetical protein KKB30_06450 [Proteobacteria bacterium]|nr:hypothetical protein [Pseudomonadota bacterium]MBU1715160.1 hypothetical protein [Pseudomonadota bacterium]